MTNLSTKSIANLCMGVCLLLLLSTIQSCKKHQEIPETPVFKVTTLATGFHEPIGLETDEKGRVWVAETGTGKGDGRVSVITANGKVYPVIIQLESFITGGGEIEGPAHILFADGILYILGGHGKLYKANVANFKIGDAPIKASKLAFEDIGGFVLSYNFEKNTHETHPYNLTVGPNGAIFITDAAANAIIRRAKNGNLSVLAEVPGIANPLPFGPPVLQSVPTGIIYDGQHFLVTTLMGFPFPTNKAIIYKISTSGNVSIYQQGFTTLVDIIKGNSFGKIVLEHGKFGPTGFILNTGRMVLANGNTATPLVEGLNTPAGLTQYNDHTWYITSVGDGSVLKVTY